MNAHAITAPTIDEEDEAWQENARRDTAAAHRGPGFVIDESDAVANELADALKRWTTNRGWPGSPTVERLRNELVAATLADMRRAADDLTARRAADPTAQRIRVWLLALEEAGA